HQPSSLPCPAPFAGPLPRRVWGQTGLAPPLPQRLSQFGLIFALSAIGIWVVWDFLPALAWAVVVAIAIWPMFEQLRLREGNRTMAAGTVTLLVGAVLIVPLIVL